MSQNKQKNIDTQTAQRNTDVSDSQNITAQAAEWLVKLDDDTDAATEQQKQYEYQAWLAEDPRHEESIQRLQKLLGEVESLANQYPDTQIPQQMIDQALSPNKQRLVAGFTKTLFGLVLALGLAGLTALQYAPFDYWIADIRNGSQSWQQNILADQSHIKIGGKGAYNVQFDETQRVIQLLQGSILVDVAKDAQRPFIVKTQHAQIKALGTRFIVTRQAEQTVLTLLESKVEVRSQSDLQNNRSQAVIVQAGQQLKINAQGFVELIPTQINPRLMEQAWQQQILVANGESLVDVLEYLALYYDGKISFDHTELAGIQVTAILPLNNIEQSIMVLVKELNLDVQTNIPFYLKVSKKD